MSDPTRERILAAFDRELGASPLPPGLRERTIRAAVTSRQPAPSRAPRMLAAIAVLVAVALVATLIVVHLRPAPTPARSSVPPSPRSQAAVAYDQAHGVMVLFGGRVGSGNDASAVNETWTWDGKYWTHQHPVVSPPPSAGGLMDYDQARREVVLLTAAHGLSTWTWNGSTWRQLHPRHTPPALSFMSAQFDPMTRGVLVYGSTADPQQTQLWSWNGSDWSQLEPATLPNGFAGSMVFDGRHVLLLSPNLVGGRFLTQTWEWDGVSWTLLNPTVNLPTIPYPVSSAYDPARGRLLLLTGDTWEWDGSTWTRQHPTVQPPTVGYMAYMTSLREAVSYDTVGGIYAWDGSNWNVIEPGPPPETTNGKGGYGRMTPDAAATLIRATVKNSRPVLLPAYLPGGPYDATITSSSADDFNITYDSDQRDKEIYFGIVVANPPPAGGPHAASSRLKFRNAIAPKFGQPGQADYVVYDTTDPYSQRYLEWTEPGTMANPQLADGGVPYFLSATGLTDQEFWQVANSLR